MKKLLIFVLLISSLTTAHSQSKSYFTIAGGAANNTNSNEKDKALFHNFLVNGYVGHRFSWSEQGSFFTEVGFTTFIDRVGIGFGTISAGFRYELPAKSDEQAKIATSLFCGYGYGGNQIKRDTHVLPDGTIHVITEGAKSGNFSSVIGGFRLEIGTFYAQTVYNQTFTSKNYRQLFYNVGTFIPF